MQECKINKFFGNKIWQAAKFSNKWLELVSEAQALHGVRFDDLTALDRWILSRLTATVFGVNENFPKYDFHNVTSALKDFLYYDFCDVFLVSKVMLWRFTKLVSCGEISFRKRPKEICATSAMKWRLNIAGRWGSAWKWRFAVWHHSCHRWHSTCTRNCYCTLRSDVVSAFPRFVWVLGMFQATT